MNNGTRRAHSDLVADRFVVTAGQLAFDLATGERVALAIDPAGTAAEQARWATRCDWFFKRRHHAFARLADYGGLGTAQRFEAWTCGPPWRGDTRESAVAFDRASAFLKACSLSPCATPGAVSACDGRPVVVPDSSCGYEAGAPAGAAIIRIDQCGVRIVERRAVAAVAELFADSSGPRPRAISLHGPPGSGLTTAVHELARAARMHGFVPLRLATASREMAPLAEGRSLLLIADGEPVRGWSGLLDWLLRSALPHVLLFAGVHEVPSLDGLALDRVAPDALVGAVEPPLLDSTGRRQVEAAAARADGLPGRFVRLLWGDYRQQPEHRSAPSRAAESPASYYVDRSGVAPSVPWPSQRPPSGELSALRRRAEAGIQLLERGRHAPGGRALRQAIGGLVRRGDWLQAARAELALARTLVSRGRIRDAESLLADLRQHAAHAHEEPSLLIDVAVLSGQTAVERGRLDEAESLLHGAVAAARSTRAAASLADSRTALARCLFWRGRYDEAHQVLSQVRTEECSNAMAIGVSLMRACVAVGRGDLGLAVSTITGASQEAERLGLKRLTAESASAAALVHLVLGDSAAIERDVARCVAAARAAHHPLCALEARLIQAESARRAGRGAAAASVVRRLRSMPVSHLPATVRARAELLGDLLDSSSAADAVVLRHTSATGFHALNLLAPARASAAPSTEPASIDDVLEVLRCCQKADDERAVLQAICASLRQRLGAALVAFVSREDVLLAVEGRRVETDIARRIVAARQMIAPHLRDGAFEAGTPVEYGGEVLAAVVARWTLGAPCDWTRGSRVMAVAATAAAAAVAEAVTRRQEAPARALDGIIGLSPAIAEVRRAIERAAAAPFAVLITGESGSGKELVARSLHRRSARRERPFCTLNCAALPDELVESELFGHARGAFTGAVAERPGVFEDAHTGTLFLDEIGELSPRAQAKVLRTIQEGDLRRVGENVARRVDVRIIAATNRDLAAEAAAGRFRLDLLYRLDVVRIAVPPLRDRRDDIALLADTFWTEATKRVGSRATLATATLAALARYDWPGNVRELQNVLAALAVRSPKRGVVGPTALPPAFGAGHASASWKLDAARRTFEERFVRAALVRTGGHRTHAAEELGVTRQGLTKLMARLGISD